MKDIINQVLIYLIQLGIVTGLGTLINFLRAKIGNEKFSTYLEYAKVAVSAAEQIFQNGSGQSKKAEVERFLSQKLSKRLTPEELDKLIEAAVFEMNMIAKGQNTGTFQYSKR
ncbi:MAG: phage holin [Bacillota bacterium]|nr:phage holin [Bacillota bacterium]